MANDTLVTSLLYEGEGVELDFKREPYRFMQASDDDKSELLKDILAFANAWRRSDAYILIGVEEVKGARSRVIGIADLLDDAALQQFVNSKTNRPVTFSYRSLSYEAKQIAVIHIPVQQRPLYLKKDYGRVRANTVYVRRGSATAIADLDEVSTMGAMHQPERRPVLDISFADPTTRRLLSKRRSAKSLILQAPPRSEIPDYVIQRSPFEFGMRSANSSYYRELVKYTSVLRAVSPFYFAISNSGGTTGTDVRVEIRCGKQAGKLLAIDQHDFPTTPRAEYNSLDFSQRVHMPRTYDVTATDTGDTWVVEGRADKVQPKATFWFQDPVYLGSASDGVVTLDVTIYCDELEQPHTDKLLIEFAAEHRKVNLDDVLELEHERFVSSAEHQRLLRQLNEDES